jgi:2-iminobutanoate/2-iminopropanoate deaminase
MQLISIDGAKQPAGHYSPATQAGSLICISGQLPINPYTGEKCTGGIKEQTQQVLQNIDAVLQGAGATKNDVMKTTVYVSDISLWDEVNAVYAGYFGSHRPARTIVPTRDLHYGFLIEIEAIAYKEV